MAMKGQPEELAAARTVIGRPGRRGYLQIGKLLKT